MDGLGGLILWVLNALFKKRQPSFLLITFAFIVILILGYLLPSVQNPDYLIITIFALTIFLVLETIGFVRVFRQKSVQDLQVFQQTPLEEQTPVPQMTAEIEPQTTDLEAQDEQEPVELSAKDHPLKTPGSQPIPDIYYLPLRRVLIMASILGYYLAHLLFSERVINWADNGASEQWARGYVGNIFIQLICGLPFLLIFGAVVTSLSIRHFMKLSANIRSEMMFLFGLIIGLVVYFPYQVFLLAAAAM